MSKTATPDTQPVLKNFVPYKPKRGEEYMNEKQREHFKQILLDWRNQLMQEVDRTVHHMQDDAANYPDPADRATQEEEFSLELRTRDRERKLIKKIDSTIELIAQDDYGSVILVASKSAFVASKHAQPQTSASTARR